MRLLASALMLAAMQAEKIDLRWKLSKGREIRYRISQRSSFDAPGTTVENSRVTTFLVTVNDLDEKGEASMIWKYESVAMKSSAPREFEYDSGKHGEPPADPRARMASLLVGRSYTVRMDPAGKIVEVRGFSDIFESLVSAAEIDPSHQVLFQSFRKSFSDESARSMFRQMFMPLPNAAVKPGESWDDDFTLELPLAGRLELGGTSRLAEVRDRRAYLEQEWKLKPRRDESPQRDEPARTVQVSDMKGRSKGVFCLERGIFVSVRSEFTTVMTAGGRETEARNVHETTLLEPPGPPAER